MDRARQNLTEFTSEYYDKYYFADEKGCEFTLADDSKKFWGYLNESGECWGSEEIVKSWKEIFDPQKVLEFGAGRGQFLAYTREQDIDVVGFDWSEYATGDDGRFNRCKKEWLIRHDATKPWPYPTDSFDLVIGLDILEHLYVSDLDFVISEMYRVANKWIFLQIATVDGRMEQGYLLNKGEYIPLATDTRTWAGHVSVQTERDWLDMLSHEDWVTRRDMANWFSALVHPKIISNWMLNSIIVLEKLD